MPITHIGLKNAMSFADTWFTNTAIIRAYGASVPESVGLGNGTAEAATVFNSDVGGDTSDSNTYKNKRYRTADVIVNITLTGEVNYIAIAQYSANFPTNRNGDYSSGYDKIFTVTLDSGINVIDGGYLTVKGGANNFFLELQSSKTV